MRVGVDTGGTFTDAAADNGVSTKVPSTPDDPAEAVRAAAHALEPAPDVLVHGTTVATNALLERAGASVALGTRKESEDKWYYAALMAASAPRDRWPAVGETLTRELDQVRLKLGAGYDGWSQRADVRALLNRSDIKEKMRHG